MVDLTVRYANSPKLVRALEECLQAATAALLEALPDQLPSA